MSHEINYENVANKLAQQLAAAQFNSAALTDLVEQQAKTIEDLKRPQAESGVVAQND